MTQKCGYIAILGRPNAGKSSLLNTLVGQKIAGVSAKPQTTRARILGIRIEGEAQFLFLDTPGIHRSPRKIALNSLMNRAAWGVLNEADAVLYIIDASADEGMDADFDFLKNVVKTSKNPVLVCLNKADKVRLEQQTEPLYACKSLMQRVRDTLGEPEASQALLPEPVFVSAKRKESLTPVLQQLSTMVPEGQWLYPADDLTDRPQTFVCAELIREQAFRCLGAELPYHVAVRVDNIEFTPKLVRIQAEIIVGRLQHKGIVVGAQGSKIKEIGSKARVSLEQHFDQKVFLEMQVVVDTDWVNDPYSVANYSEMDEFRSDL